MAVIIVQRDVMLLMKQEFSEGNLSDLNNHCS